MSEQSYKQLKDTVFLPKTTFPMKANLAQRGNTVVEEWKKCGIYKKLRDKATGRQQYILHWGPPYANGHIHMGHVLTGVLKDAVNKFYQMLGYDAPLVIGWDCHGLPIEWKVEEEYLRSGVKRENVKPTEFLKKCRSFANDWVNTQRAEFESLGIVSDFENYYCTMSKESEATICQKFYEIYKNGLVYRGEKPVMWSVVEKTALAEAELEYHDKVSDAIYVKFPVQNKEKLFAVIWTTTPWTIPGNRAIAYSADVDYVLVEANDEQYIIASELVEHFVRDAKIETYTVKGNIILADMKCSHPLLSLGYSFDVPFLPAKHVTTDAGTGLVHTAPAHGLEDFQLGKQYNLEIKNVIDSDGIVCSDIPVFAGEHVFKVNDHVIDELKKANNIITHQKITHSYPHSWRSKAPLIFRTTSQWFIAIDKIREKLLEEVNKATWYPSEYINRIRSMIQNRGDWCISRQRLWGVPIALFINKNDGTVLDDDSVFNRVLQCIKDEGIEGWHNHDVSYFIGAERAEQYEKVKDTLEVWFDSACSHHYVLEARNSLSWPADLYFEGSDQHRGWFQSSLVESVCTNGKAPYKNVVTHGFVLDQNGKKMSKSLGNVIHPKDVVAKYGTDVLRLWCLNSDYSEDMRIGDEILSRQMDVYRKFRNCLRYLLGVLSNSHHDYVEYSDLPELERLMLHKLYELDQVMREDISKYEIQHFCTTLHNFCTNDLSSFYFDIRKDCVYCDDNKSQKRMACIYVMSKIFECLCHWLAPILSFTADEAWLCYNANNASIYLNDFPEINKEWQNCDVNSKWNTIRSIRKVITSALEIERMTKSIGTSLEADVYIYTTNLEITKMLQTVQLDEIAIVASTTCVHAQIPSNAHIDNNLQDVGVIVRKSQYKKCDRCWRVLNSVTETNCAYGNVNLCSRCKQVIDV